MWGASRPLDGDWKMPRPPPSPGIANTCYYYDATKFRFSNDHRRGRRGRSGLFGVTFNLQRTSSRCRTQMIDGKAALILYGVQEKTVRGEVLIVIPIIINFNADGRHDNNFPHN